MVCKTEVNPGTESNAILAEAERLNLNVIQACSILGSVRKEVSQIPLFFCPSASLFIRYRSLWICASFTPR
jgi:hypothetical protein